MYKFIAGKNIYSIYTVDFAALAMFASILNVPLVNGLFPQHLRLAIRPILRLLGSGAERSAV